MADKHRVILRYLKYRWHKKTLVISKEADDCFYKIHSLGLVNCSAYLKVEKKFGCVFDMELWPFDHKNFDLIILDDAIPSKLTNKSMKSLLSQLHFCLADDGEVIVAGGGDIRGYSLISKFISNGFFSKKVELIHPSESYYFNVLKSFITYNYVAIFKKDRLFKFDGVDIVKILSKRKSFKPCMNANMNNSGVDNYNE